MSDELSALGVSWREEEHVRQSVAASVAADSSPEAFEDQQAMNKAWAELTNAENTMLSLEGLPIKDRPKDYDLRLLAAQRDVKAKSSSVQQLQKKVETRKNQRIAVALASQIKQVAEVKREQMIKKEGGEPVGGRIEIAQRPAAPVHPYRPLHKSIASVVPASSRSATTGNVVTDAVRDYQGGELLEPVHSMIITKTDRVAAARKYMDDGDEDVFNARQAALKEAAIDVDDDDDEEEEGDLFDQLVKVEEDGLPAPPEQRARRTLQPEPKATPVVELPQYTLPAKTYEQLLDYQRVGLSWLVCLHHKKTGGILGDEMGLGKTVQVAALLNTLLSSKALLGPVLIVTPLTVVAQWVSELHIWCPELRTCILHSSGTNQSLESVIASVRNKPAAVITTYASLTLKSASITPGNFQYVILDEGHKICNPETGVTIASKTFVTPHRLILTGSPIQNTLKELWCLFDFAKPGLLGTLQRFIDEFEGPINASRNPRATTLEIATAMECAKVLREYIQPFLLRRLKKDVNAMLPAKYERVIRCSLTDVQLEAYVDVLKSKEVQEILGNPILHRFYSGGLNQHGRDATGSLWTGPKQYSGRKGMSTSMRREAFRVLHALRCLCNHVDIFYVKHDDVVDGGSGRDISFRSNKEVRYEGSSKLATLKKLLEHWKAHGHKVIVFSQFRMMLDIIENMCEQEKHSYMRMDGTTPPRDRSILIDKFNTDPSVFVALLTTKVGGLGVNLTGADRVVIFDPDWNPVNDEQARERAWRIGQTREVCVYRMISSGTIEETILHRQLAKTYVTEKVLNDPTLQRCFSMHSFVDAFYLSTEYATRVPMHAQHVISTIGDMSAMEADAEMERENDEVLKPLMAHHASAEENANEAQDTQKKLEVLSKRHAVEGGGSFRVTSHGSTPSQGSPPPPLFKRETSSSRSSATLNSRAPTPLSRAPSSAPSSQQLQILQQMVDGDAEGSAPSSVITGNSFADRVARNLVRATAQTTLRRAVVGVAGLEETSGRDSQPQTPTLPRSTRGRPPQVKREREES